MPIDALLESDQAAVVRLDAAEPAGPASIVSRVLLRSPEMRLTHFAFAAGQELTVHTNRRRALVQVLTGAGDFYFNETWRRLEAGALLHLPPNHPHAVRAAEPFTMLLTLSAEPAAPFSSP